MVNIKLTARLCAAASVALCALVQTTAHAQIPPHPPGSICFTPNFWCWLPYPFPPGSPCACMTQGGAVPGRAG
jgi:hypothetical protein